jgi:hypothetical protein
MQQDCLFSRILKSRASPLGTRAMLVTWLGTWSNGRDSPRGLMVEKSEFVWIVRHLQASAEEWAVSHLQFFKSFFASCATKFVRAG